MKSATTVVAASSLPVVVALAAIALAAPSSIAAAVEVLPFGEFAAPGFQGHAVFDVAAAPDNTTLDVFESTVLVPARRGSFNLIADQEDIYAPGSHRSKFLLLYAPAPTEDDSAFQLRFPPQALIAELLAGTTPGVTLYVGADINFDGLPQADELICQVQATAAPPARCILDQAALQSPLQAYWVMAAAPSGELGITYTAFVSAGLPYIAVPKNPETPPGSLSQGQTVVTGPGHVAGSDPFALRMTWRFGAPDRSYYGAVLLGSGGRRDLIDGASAILPFALNQTITTANASFPIFIDPVVGTIQGGSDRPLGAYFPLQAHEMQTRLFFDLPPSDTPYDPIRIDTYGFGFGTLASADFYAARTDFPSSSSNVLVDAAPSAANAAVAWKLGDPSPVIAHPSSGRWYIVATNTGSLANFSIQFGDSLAGVGRETPTVAPGQYFNPQRSGHGLSISQAAGQQLVFWYSYLDDGTPTWYIAQAPAPAANSGWWTSPLYRVAWNGSAGTPTQVGYVSLTPTATNRFMFTWYLEGEQGSEAFELLAPAHSCPDLGGVPTNLAGNWFAPAQSGYGVDVIALPDQQFDLAYFYDSLGIARWGIGAAPFAQNSTLGMLQSSGFCPLCASKPVTTQPLGPMSMDFANAGNGNLAMGFALKAPLIGNWTVAQPMLRLTGSAACE